VGIYTATATDPSNDTSSFSGAVGSAPAAADLGVSETVDSGPVAVGSNLGYTIAVQNRGTGIATGVTLTHMLPATVSFVAGAQANHAYYYQVSALVGGLESFHSNEAGGDTLTTPVLSASTIGGPAGDGSVYASLQYSSPGGQAALYNVYRTTSPGGEGATPYTTGVNADPALFLQPRDSTCYYQISAVVGGYESPRSNEVQVSAPLAGTTIQQIHEGSLKVRGKKQSVIVVSFSDSLNPADARDLAAYHLVALGKAKKSGVRASTGVKLTTATYDLAMHTVTLTIKGKLPTQPLQLSISGGSVVDANGQSIDGNHDGQPGGNFQATFTKAGVKLASASAR
jgi:uncharacterized repeat protein (TIGR01451 family)